MPRSFHRHSSLYSEMRCLTMQSSRRPKEGAADRGPLFKHRQHRYQCHERHRDARWRSAECRRQGGRRGRSPRRQGCRSRQQRAPGQGSAHSLTRPSSSRRGCAVARGATLFVFPRCGRRARAPARGRPHLMKEGSEDWRRIGASVDDPPFGEGAAARQRTKDDCRCGHLLQKRVDDGDRQTGCDHAQNGSS